MVYFRHDGRETRPKDRIALNSARRAKEGFAAFVLRALLGLGD